MKAAAYIRTSREFKNIERVSIPQQINDAQELAKKSGLTLPSSMIFIDEDRSGTYPPEQWEELAPVSDKTGKASTQRRAGFTELVKAIESGKAKSIICRKRNRLCRNFEQHRKFAQLLKQHKVKLFCTHETVQQGGDTTSEFSADILALLAEFQLKQSRDDVLAAKKYSKDNGRKMGWVQTVGYRDAGTQKIDIVPEEAELVNEVYKRYTNKKQSINSLTQWLDENYPANKIISGKNRKKWYPQTVKLMLTNPCYIGMTRDSNCTLIESKVYEAIVPVALWHETQERIKSTRNVKHGVKYTEHILGGCLHCDSCGERIVIHREVNKRADGTENNYYTFLCSTHSDTCKADQKAAYLREEELELWLERYFAHAVPASQAEQDNEEIALLLVKQGELDNSLQELYSRTDIALDSSLAREKAYKAELKKIERQIEKLRSQKVAAVRQWQDMDTTEKRQRVKELTVDIRVSRNFVTVVWKDSLKFDKGFYSHLDTVDIDDSDSSISPMAFPIMQKMINRHWRNAIVPENPIDVSIQYDSTEIGGKSYLVPDWEESSYKDKKHSPVINSTFKQR